MTASAGPPKRTGRGDFELRAISFECGAAPYAEGSCLVSFGDTRVLCTASVEEGVPAWRENGVAGWVTAEYGMLPRATHSRRARERAGAGGRTREIERLIGRSLRAVTDLRLLGRRTVVVDCDVIQADGGTRTASITGGFIALVLALDKLRAAGTLAAVPVDDYVAAISVGIVGGMPLVDLAYEQDAAADVDMNVVKTGNGRFIEVQGTAEGEPFDRGALDELLRLADRAIAQLVDRQRAIVGDILNPRRA